MEYKHQGCATLLRDLHPCERPAYKLKAKGAEALADEELLAIVLGSDDGLIRARKALEIGQTEEALIKARALPPKRRAVLRAALELARRLHGRGAGRLVLDSAARIFEAVPPEVKQAKKEHLLAFYLNARSQLLRQETISIGTLSANLVHPREVFAPAVAHSAAAVIVVHNHPSGDCSPSPEDRDTTQRLCRAGEILGIPLVDHVIIPSGESRDPQSEAFFSFREHGLMR